MDVALISIINAFEIGSAVKQIPLVRNSTYGPAHMCRPVDRGWQAGEAWISPNFKGWASPNLNTYLRACHVIKGGPHKTNLGVWSVIHDLKKTYVLQTFSRI